MADLNWDVLLQVEKGNGAFQCWAFSGVPATRPSWIALVSTGSIRGLEDVADLATEMKAILENSSPEVIVEEILCPEVPSSMNPADYPSRRKLLVLVAAEGAPFRDTRWYNNWSSDEYDAAVMTAIPRPDLEAFLDPEIQSDKHLLRRTNAKSWSGSIREIIPAVMSRADITSEVTRIFVSYRRLETLPVALQLFDRLTHEGFDVFLDRFSIPPGYDFQRRLNQELEDKSMVILLESSSLKDSKWTQHEIDFAKRFRLGLACVRMPNLKDDEILLSVRNRPRIELEHNPPDIPPSSDFVEDPVPRQDPKDPDRQLVEWQRLTGDAEERVVSFIKKEHANALFERRQRLRKDVANALAAAGIRVTANAVGPMRADVGLNQHLIWITTRPPEVDDFRNLHGAHVSRPQRQAGWRGALVGPQAALEPDRRKQLKWLEARTECLSFDEAKLSDFAHRVATWT